MLAFLFPIRQVCRGRSERRQAAASLRAHSSRSLKDTVLRHPCQDAEILSATHRVQNETDTA